MIPILATTDAAARVAIVQGYNDDVEQTQDTPGGPVTRHPSPFTGLEGTLDVRLNYAKSDHSLRLGARGQHYEPIEKFAETDDGTASAAWTSRFLLNKNDTLRLTLAGTYSKLNSARISDGIIFQFNPTSLDRTFLLVNGETAYLHELSARWRVQQAFGFILSETVRQPPVPLSNGQSLVHKGLDYSQPYSETSLLHDFDARNTGDLIFVYQYTHTPVVYDFVGTRPTDIGPADTHIGTLTTGLSHLFSVELHTLSRVGVTVASSPPQDADSRPVVQPTFGQDVYYTKPYWSFRANVGYVYGATNPQVGSGATLTGGTSLIGTPFPSSVTWRNFAVLFEAQASYTSLAAGATPTTQNTPTPVLQSSELSLVAGTAQVRYAFNDWLGLLAGYDLRYAIFAGSSAFPPFFQQMVYIGLSGFWSTDRTIPVLTTFAPPLTSG